MTNNKKATMLALATIGTLLAVSPVAEARWGRGGRGGGGGYGGWGPGGGPGGWGGGRGGPGGRMGMGRCGRMLLHARGDQIKARLGLDDAQLARVMAIRSNFLHKRIDLRAKLDKRQLELRQLMDKDLPPQNKVLQLMRKRRAVRGVLAEERMKTYLKTLAVLNPGQRTQLRTQCQAWGPRNWRGPRGRGGRGPGPGWGGQGRGPGWGGPPPPPPASK